MSLRRAKVVGPDDEHANAVVVRLMDDGTKWVAEPVTRAHTHAHAQGHIHVHMGGPAASTPYIGTTDGHTTHRRTRAC